MTEIESEKETLHVFHVVTQKRNRGSYVAIPVINKKRRSDLLSDESNEMRAVLGALRNIVHEFAGVAK